MRWERLNHQAVRSAKKNEVTTEGAEGTEDGREKGEGRGEIANGSFAALRMTRSGCTLAVSF
jgi:hypothetical protein